MLGSGAILREVIKAAEVLAANHGVTCDVFSVTSYSELAREAIALQRLGRSDTREQLRRFFEVDTASIVRAALGVLQGR